MRENDKNNVINTLCVVHTDTHILLGMKKRGFGKGRWNGFGGKPDKHETIEEAARRELIEEAGIIPKSLEKHGHLTFIGESEDNIVVHVFRVNEFDGDPTESDEMAPKWFHHDEIPYDDMWPDDKHWLPLFLNGKKFKGNFTFVNDKIVDFNIKTLEELE